MTFSLTLAHLAGIMTLGKHLFYLFYEFCFTGAATAAACR
jgi:hypothetical protein